MSLPDPTWLLAILALVLAAGMLLQRRRHRNAVTQLRAEIGRAETVLNALPDAIIQFNAEGTLCYLNPAAQTMLGGTVETLRDRNIESPWRLIGHNSRDSVLEILLSRTRKESPVRIPTNARLISHQGLELEVEGTCRVLRNGQGDLVGYQLQLQDITEAQEWRRQQPDLWDRDPVSALPGHHFLENRLNRALQNRRTGDLPMTYARITVDGVSAVYERFGTVAGDTLIRHLVALLRAHVRDTDLIARIDAQTFAILLTNCPTEVSRRISQAIVSGLTDFRFAWDSLEHPIHASLSQIDVPPFEGCLEELLAAARTSQVPRQEVKDAGPVARSGIE